MRVADHGGLASLTIRSLAQSLGSKPMSVYHYVASKDEIKWDKTPTGQVVQGVFTIISEMGMTGQVVLLDQTKWDALQKSKLISHFFIAMLWGGTPLKIVDDAVMMAKRGT